MKKERRKSQRYETEMKVHYQVSYDVKTKVKFRIFDLMRRKLLSRKYSGVSRNVSVNGLCFIARKKLNEGDLVLLEVYAPIAKTPIHMRGEVKWIQDLSPRSGKKSSFLAGVELVSVEGENVFKSIHFDKQYRVNWSIVLESLFGSFKVMARNLHKNRAHSL